MPHYVLELRRPKGQFAVYSTIVDNLITAPMDASEMRSWLEEREYDSWLKEGGRSLEEWIEDYGEDIGRSIYENQERTADYYYWNEEEKFTYTKEVDEFFCLPRSLWRME